METSLSLTELRKGLALMESTFAGTHMCALNRARAEIDATVGVNKLPENAVDAPCANTITREVLGG